MPISAAETRSATRISPLENRPRKPFVDLPSGSAFLVDSEGFGWQHLRCFCVSIMTSKRTKSILSHGGIASNKLPGATPSHAVGWNAGAGLVGLDKTTTQWTDVQRVLWPHDELRLRALPFQPMSFGWLWFSKMAALVVLNLVHKKQPPLFPPPQFRNAEYLCPRRPANLGTPPRGSSFQTLRCMADDVSGLQQAVTARYHSASDRWEDFPRLNLAYFRHGSDRLFSGS